MDSNGFGDGLVTGCYEHNNESSGTEYDQPSDYEGLYPTELVNYCKYIQNS
jgi:hypothetical protein